MESSEDEDFLEVIDELLQRQPRNFRICPNHMETLTDNEFIERYRITKNTATIVSDLISEEVSNQTIRNKALSTMEMLLMTLRFFATGSFLQVTGDLHGVHKGTACKIVDKVSFALARLGREFIAFPSTMEGISNLRVGFYNIARFPRCIGALDCTHIRIQSPGGENPEIFRNRKGYFSFNVQAVCDSNLYVRDVVCRWPGSTHDAHIFRSSSLRRRFERNEFNDSILIGDSGYGVRSYLMTPLGNPQTPAEHLFNESLIRTRNPIERCFGVLKRRFPILSNTIRLDIKKVEQIVVACIVLHNIALRQNDPAFENEIIEEDHIQENNPYHIHQNNNARVPLLNYFETLLHE